MDDYIKVESFVDIELFVDHCYTAGQPLQGKIHLFAKEAINDVHKITLTLVGKEYVGL